MHRRFFQELVLHLQVAVAALKLPQPRPLGQLQRRLIAGVLLTVRPDPIPERRLIDSEFPRHIRDRA
jgi:hypothetical protein